MNGGKASGPSRRAGPRARAAWSGGDSREAGRLGVLLIEDSEVDALLLLRQIRKGGIDPDARIVCTEADLRAALAERAWDVILCDFSMPAFDALSALAIVRERGVDPPFIVVSGAIGEEIAVEAMRAGANDYLLKDRLARLVPAVEREIRAAAIRAERRQIQEHLIVSDRMASVGMLAAGVAHEINNPLAVVLGNLHYAIGLIEGAGRGCVSDDVSRQASAADPGCDSLVEALRDAHEAAQAVRRIAGDLRVFSRSAEESRGPVDAKDVMESSLRMCGAEIRHRARVVREYGDVPLVEANTSRLGQVFLNLLVNAAQAIPDGHANENVIRVSASLAFDGFVVVEVADTGSGIPPEHMARIFEPFITTKPEGVGTGLGLAIVRRIVDSFGGSVEVESQLGVGTTFRVSLPAARSARAEPAPGPPPPRNRTPGVGRLELLVIDDEVLFARSLERLLASEFEVTAVHRGDDALALVASGRRYDAILCDVMMPRMSGMELHGELARLAPGIEGRMVFATGGAFTAEAREFLGRVTNPRVAKPFDPDEILTALLSVAQPGDPTTPPPT